MTTLLYSTQKGDPMRLLRVEEVAHVLGLKPSTVRKMIYLRELPVVRPTKRAVRVREADVEALARIGYRPPSSKASARLEDHA
jgi:excisionase family DNA binding protein